VDPGLRRDDDNLLEIMPDARREQRSVKADD